LKHAVIGRWHVGVAQQVLAKDFAGFQLGGQLGRAERPQTGGLEGVHNSGRQSRFRADHSEANAILPREVQQPRHIRRWDIDVFAFASRARVAGRDKHTSYARTLGELPRQGVLSAAAANY
jgi:hypothetical protein